MLRRLLGPVLALFFSAILAGCAAFSSGPAADAKRCAETPQNAVLTFLQGIAEFSLRLIKAVLPDGVSAFTVLGGGDDAHGREIARQLFRHPEVIPAGSSVGMVPSLAAMEHLGHNEWRVTIEREDLVTIEGKEDETKSYRRRFLARFDPEGNCITAVRALDPGWQRIR